MAIDKIQSESINLADTFAFTGTVTGAGEANTPNFYAYGVDQAVSDNTSTKLTFSSEVVDSDSAYDTSAYRFTVPSGKGGLYFFNTTFRFQGGMLSQLSLNYKKNGSNISSFYDYSGGVGTAIYNSQEYTTRNVTLLQNLSAGDYIEVFALFDIISGSTLQCDTRQNVGEFSGFRITS